MEATCTSIRQQRLADLLEEYPDAADELRDRVQRLRADLPEPQQTWVHTYIARDPRTAVQRSTRLDHDHQPP